MRGYFKNGKAQGPGRFTAPGLDVFYGEWNTQSKRHGKGLSINLKTNREALCVYDNGKITKRYVEVWRGPRMCVCIVSAQLGAVSYVSEHVAKLDINRHESIVFI